jgi:hypothetical protein
MNGSSILPCLKYQDFVLTTEATTSPAALLLVRESGQAGLYTGRCRLHGFSR